MQQPVAPGRVAEAAHRHGRTVLAALAPRHDVVPVRRQAAAERADGGLDARQGHHGLLVAVHGLAPPWTGGSSTDT